MNANVKLMKYLLLFKKKTFIIQMFYLFMDAKSFGHFELQKKQLITYKKP